MTFHLSNSFRSILKNAHPILDHHSRVISVLQLTHHEAFNPSNQDRDQKSPMASRVPPLIAQQAHNPLQRARRSPSLGVTSTSQMERRPQQNPKPQMAKLLPMAAQLTLKSSKLLQKSLSRSLIALAVASSAQEYISMRRSPQSNQDRRRALAA